MHRTHLSFAACFAIACSLPADDDAPDTRDTATTETGGPEDTGARLETGDTQAVETADTASTDLAFSVRLAQTGSGPAPCDVAALQALLHQITTWQTARSCSFASAGLTTTGADLALKLHLDVDDTDALTVGERFQVTWDPLAGISQWETTGSLRLEEGADLFDAYCDDVGTPTTPTRTWAPVDGYMRLEVTGSDGTWEPWGAPFEADVVLRGVELEDTDRPGTTCTLPDMDLEGLDLGWLPG